MFLRSGILLNESDTQSSTGLHLQKDDCKENTKDTPQSKEQNEQSQEPSPEESKKQNKSRNGKVVETQGFKESLTGNKPELVNLRAMHPKLLETSDCISIILEDEPPQAISSKQDSWVELLIRLIGGIYEINPDTFLGTLGYFGILSDNIQMRKAITTYLDTDLQDNLKIYGIPETDYLLIVKGNSYSLLKSIKQCIKALNVQIKQTKVIIAPPGYEGYGVIDNDYVQGLTEGQHGASINRGKARKIGDIGNKLDIKTANTSTKKSKASTKSQEAYQNTISDTLDTDDIILKRLKKMETTYTLSDLHYNGIPDNSSIVSVELFDEATPVRSIQQLVEITLTFLMVLEETAREAAIKNTIPARIGLTDDVQAYIGSIREVPIPSTNLYFYSNGNQKEAIDYLFNVVSETKIKPDEIKIKMESLGL